MGGFSYLGVPWAGFAALTVDNSSYKTVVSLNASYEDSSSYPSDFSGLIKTARICYPSPQFTVRFSGFVTSGTYSNLTVKFISYLEADKQHSIIYNEYIPTSASLAYEFVAFSPYFEIQMKASSTVVLSGSVMFE